MGCTTLEYLVLYYGTTTLTLPVLIAVSITGSIYPALLVTIWYIMIFPDTTSTIELYTQVLVLLVWKVLGIYWVMQVHLSPIELVYIYIYLILYYYNQWEYTIILAKYLYILLSIYIHILLSNTVLLLLRTVYLYYSYYTSTREYRDIQV